MDIYQHVLDDGLGGADELDAIYGATYGATDGATEHPQTAANGNGSGVPESALESRAADTPEALG
jgi:hypothetical protein